MRLSVGDLHFKSQDCKCAIRPSLPESGVKLLDLAQELTFRIAFQLAQYFTRLVGTFFLVRVRGYSQLFLLQHRMELQRDDLG